MSNAYSDLQSSLKTKPKVWLLTGCAGFIGSNLLEELLKLGQTVIGLDNFSTGSQRNLDEVRTLVTSEQWARFTFYKGDIRNFALCQRACQGVDYVLHQAALGSVPRSIKAPLDSHDSNVNGHLNVLMSAQLAKVKRVVYASSSSVYGDHPGLPKIEDQTGRLLSPYAATKAINEIYSQACEATYGLESVGLRYFNVFGRRQDPSGPYAAVIPLWFNAILKGQPVYVNGDGQTSRDFTYIDHVIQANLLAATALLTENVRVFNVACGERTTLNQLFSVIQNQVVRVLSLQQSTDNLDVAQKVSTVLQLQLTYRAFREGDIRHSLADITRAKRVLGYDPQIKVEKGLELSAEWYWKFFA